MLVVAAVLVFGVLLVAGFGFSVAVPAFGALSHSQHPGFAGAWWADRLTGGAARDRHPGFCTGVAVQDTAQDRPDTDPLTDGQLPGHLRSDRGEHR